MRRPRILNAEPNGYSSRARAELEEVADVTEEVLDREALMRALPVYDALIVRLGHLVDAPLLEAGPQLRVVATATTGLDHIDLEAAKERGVEVLSRFGARATSCAGLWLLLSTPGPSFWPLLRPAALIASAAAEKGEWDRDAFRGRELDGKRLGNCRARPDRRARGTVRSTPSAWRCAGMIATGRSGPLT